MNASNFGLAELKEEGAPVNPDTLTWECDLDKCEKCRAKYDRQKKAYEDYLKNRSK